MWGHYSEIFAPARYRLDEGHRGYVPVGQVDHSHDPRPHEFIVLFKAEVQIAAKMLMDGVPFLFFFLFNIEGNLLLH